MADDMNRLGRWSGAALALGLALLVPAPRAEAATACGTIITNVATATMWSGFPNFVAYEVSYNATATLQVLCPPVVALRKFSNRQYAETAITPAGGLVTFLICVENQTVNSVWGMTITDRMPINMTWNADDTGTSGYNLTGAPSVWPPTFVYSTNNTTWSAPAASPAVGTAVPLYMRWIVEKIGPNRSACVSYTARVL